MFVGGEGRVILGIERYRKYSGKAIYGKYYGNFYKIEGCVKRYESEPFFTGSGFAPQVVLILAGIYVSQLFIKS